MLFSLSKYYPPQTIYFHSFPVGQDSNFFNPMPVWVDALAPGRALTCAGNDTRIIVFDGVTTQKIIKLLHEELGVPMLSYKHIVRLPEGITFDIQGAQRNEAIKRALADLVPDHSLVMSQPYHDPRLSPKYQFSSELSVWLNDKENLAEIFPQKHLVQRSCSFRNGEEFSAHHANMEFPCVVKVASSGAGDGVQICKNKKELLAVQVLFKDITGPLFIEEFIQAKENLCVQFGVPFDETQPVEIIGVHEQLVTGSGGFLGGIVDPRKTWKQMDAIRSLLLTDMFPRVRKKGWYGVCGVDVLVSENGNFYFIDGNFRMNASLPYLCQSRNKQILSAMLNFTGFFRGSEEDFRRKIFPLARHGHPNQILNIINMARSEDRNGFRFNAAMLFDSPVSHKIHAQKLIAAGIESHIITSCAQEGLRE